MRYERANIQRMHGYVPGEQPQSGGVVKLNTNENPYPPAGAVLDALHRIDGETLRRYPPPSAEPFREAAAACHGLVPSEVIATNGGDELLRLVLTTFAEPGRPVGTAGPGYSLYPVLAAIHGCPFVELPLQADWSLPQDLAARLNAEGVQVTFLVNPHAPSGFLTPVERLAAIARELEGLLLIDEAYVDFADPQLRHDAVELVHSCDNVLLLRSMSKGYSLAGLRFGYGLGPAHLIEPMVTKTKDSYNTDAVAQVLARTALEQRSSAQKSWEAVRAERQRLAAALQSLGLPCAPSQANFLLATVPPATGAEARGLYEALREQRIHVRYFDDPRLRQTLRITIGTPEQNGALLEALEPLLGRGSAR